MDFPGELMAEILVRLPVRSLLKFRCVCKGWRDLIGSRRFINAHLNHPSQNHRSNNLLLKRCDATTQSTALHFYGRRGSDDDLHHMAASHFVASGRWRSISAACNGIFCYEESSGMFLCNPATRQIRRVPDRPFGIPFPDPSNYQREIDSFGLGIDPFTGEYKLVVLVFFRFVDEYSGDSGLYQAEVYNLSSNSWRVVENDTAQEVMGEECLFLSLGDKCLFFNGYLHWVLFDYDMDTELLCFDMSDETMEKMATPVPSPHARSTAHAHLSVINDSLALLVHEVADLAPLFEGALVFHDFRGKSRIVVWMMREYGVEESWTKAFCVGPFNEQICNWTTFQCWNDDVLIFHTMDGELASCSLVRDQEEEDDDHQLGQIRKHNVPGHLHPSGFDYSTLWCAFQHNMEGIIIDKESLLPLPGN